MLFLPVKDKDEWNQSVESNETVGESNAKTTEWWKWEGEVTAIKQCNNIQYIVYTVIDYHFVSKICFQGPKEDHTGRID